MADIIAYHPWDGNIRIKFKDMGGYHVEMGANDSGAAGSTSITGVPHVVVDALPAVGIAGVPHVIVDSMPPISIAAAVAPAPWMANSQGLALATAAAVVMAAAPGANLANYVDSLQLCNTSTTTATVATLLDGANIIWTGYLPATVVGLNTLQAVPVLIVFQNQLKCTANTALSLKLATAGAAVYWSAQGQIK